MRWRGIGSALATVSLMLAGTATAAAQSPASFNYYRANQHFLNSRYSYRTLYSYAPPAVSAAYAPFLYQNQFIEPSISRQRIMPRGYERFDVIPGWGGTMITPFGFSSYYVPGFSHAYYAPSGGPAVEYYYR
ncbi:MAG: hypothetical protein ACRELF_19145 [Gemmataceae bacterium]